MANNHAVINKKRLLRSSNPELYIFYYSNTRDADFLEIVKEEIREEYLEYLTYADLKLK